MALRGVAHRLGGTHRVRDQDKTNTIYDDWNYTQLKAECIARSVYVKDMKKVAGACPRKIRSREEKGGAQRRYRA
jgi:hypothetical protein